MTNPDLMEAKAGWVPTAEFFPKDSIGYTLVTETPLLGGRYRPVAKLNQPLGYLTLPPSCVRKFQALECKTIGDVLGIPDPDIQSLPTRWRQRVRDGLLSYIEGLALTPHARLMRAVFGEEQPPVPAPLEGRFMQAVEGQVGTLSPREQGVLVLRFGLDDGIRNTLEKTGLKLNLTREGIRQIENKALRKLRHRSKASYLRLWIPFPQDSLGFAIFADLLPREPLPYMNFFDDLSLSEKTRRLFHAKGFYDYGLLETALRQSAANLPSEIIGEVEHALRLHLAGLQ